MFFSSKLKNLGWFPHVMTPITPQDELSSIDSLLARFGGESGIYKSVDEEGKPQYVLTVKEGGKEGTTVILSETEVLSRIKPLAMQLGIHVPPNTNQLSFQREYSTPTTSNPPSSYTGYGNGPQV